jgi:hypothetical protein
MKTGLARYHAIPERRLYCAPIADIERYSVVQYGELRTAELAERVEKGPVLVHTFVQDAKFESLFNTAVAVEKFASTGAAITGPDFSIPASATYAVAMFQVWRHNVICQVLQSKGVRVVPSLQWGPREEGLQQWIAAQFAEGSAIALRTPPEYDHRFGRMLDWFCDRIQPAQILWIGGHRVARSGNFKLRWEQKHAAETY